MPALIIAAILIVCVLYWIVRRYQVPLGPGVSANGIDGLRNRTGSQLADDTRWRLDQVKDARFAAAILMLQIVRTGSAVTRAERDRILGLLADPLQVRDPAAMLESAMDYAGARRPFRLTAEPLLPLLRRRLTADECDALIAMLTAVAGAHSPPSDLQRAAIAYVRDRLCAGPRRPVAGR